MKFKYKEDLSKGNPVAALYKFAGRSETLCLNMKLKNPEKSLWCYEDGTMEVQSGSFGLKDDPIKIFYKGDEITIQF